MTGKNSHVSPQPASSISSPVIDAHVHLLPDPVLEAIQTWFRREVSWAVPEVTTADIVEFVDTSLDGAVCFPYAHKPGVARSMNRNIANVTEGMENVIGLATVHAGDDDPDEVVRKGVSTGLRGVKLHCPVQEFPPDDARLDSVYELAVDRELPMVIHASSHPFYRGSELIGPDAVKRVLERFPTLRLCVPHLGLFETRRFLDLAGQYDGLAFDTAVATGERTHELIGIRDGEFPLERLRDHADRIMFGSDYPTYPRSISHTDHVSATAATFPEHREDVFHRNARGFFGFDDQE